MCWWWVVATDWADDGDGDGVWCGLVWSGPMERMSFKCRALIEDIGAAFESPSQSLALQIQTLKEPDAIEHWRWLKHSPWMLNAVLPMSASLLNIARHAAQCSEKQLTEEKLSVSIWISSLQFCIA